MGRDLFEQFVAEAVETLPEFFQQEMENVEVVVEDWPDPDTMRRAGVKHRSHLLGFYHGIPKTKPEPTEKPPDLKSQGLILNPSALDR